MRDPHVVSLHYRVDNGEGVTFVNPPPVFRETDNFVARLEDGKLAFDLKKHCASSQEAQDCVAGFLRAWEIDVSLRFGKDEINFVYEDADIVTIGAHRVDGS